MKLIESTLNSMKNFKPRKLNRDLNASQIKPFHPYNKFKLSNSTVQNLLHLNSNIYLVHELHRMHTNIKVTAAHEYPSLYTLAD